MSSKNVFVADARCDPTWLRSLPSDDTVSLGGGLYLTPRMALLYVLVKRAGEASITMLFEQMAERRPDRGMQQRDMQQWLGPYITKLNRRLKKQHEQVKPGRLKGTYTLVKVK